MSKLWTVLKYIVILGLVCAGVWIFRGAMLYALHQDLYPTVWDGFQNAFSQYGVDMKWPTVILYYMWNGIPYLVVGLIKVGMATIFLISKIGSEILKFLFGL